MVLSRHDREVWSEFYSVFVIFFWCELVLRGSRHQARHDAAGLPVLGLEDVRQVCSHLRHFPGKYAECPGLEKINMLPGAER